MLLANATFEAVNKIGYLGKSIDFIAVRYLFSLCKEQQRHLLSLVPLWSAVREHGDLSESCHTYATPYQIDAEERNAAKKDYEYSHNMIMVLLRRRQTPAAIVGSSFYELENAMWRRMMQSSKNCGKKNKGIKLQYKISLISNTVIALVLLLMLFAFTNLGAPDSMTVIAVV